MLPPVRSAGLPSRWSKTNGATARTFYVVREIYDSSLFSLNLGNIDSDKKFVLANYKSAPPVMRERISKFIKDSEYFTPEEKASIK